MLTVKEVKERATTPEKALDVSIQHHEENLELSEEEVRAKANTGLLGDHICGLCVHHDQDCSSCILEQNDHDCCDDSSQFSKTVSALNNWRKDGAPFSDYRVEQFKMVELLKKLKRENYGKSKCEGSPKLRLGDYGYTCDKGDPRILIEYNGQPSHVGKTGILKHPSINMPMKSEFVLGNIFDDLKAIQEKPLKEYYKGNSSSPFSSLRFVPKRNFIEAGVNGETIKIPKGEFCDFVLNLRRLAMGLGLICKAQQNSEG